MRTDEQKRRMSDAQRKRWAAYRLTNKKPRNKKRSVNASKAKRKPAKKLAKVSFPGYKLNDERERAELKIPATKRNVPNNVIETDPPRIVLEYQAQNDTYSRATFNDEVRATLRAYFELHPIDRKTFLDIVGIVEESN